MNTAPTPLVPGSRLCYPGKGALADVPSLKLSPIVFGRYKIVYGCLDVTSLLPTEDAHGDGCSLTAQIKSREHRSTDNLLAEERIIMGKDRRVGRGI